MLMTERSMSCQHRRLEEGDPQEGCLSFVISDPEDGDLRENVLYHDAQDMVEESDDDH